LQGYLDGLPTGVRPLGPISAACPGSPQIADRLLDLYLAGTKTAGSGLVEDYLTARDPLPKVGDHWIFLDSGGRPRCILRTSRVEMRVFRDVPERIAVAEGEGDLSLAYWKRAPAEHYRPHLSEWGIDDIEAATVVTEFFTLVHR
jgi:uncharacterized protein YhfF